MTAVVGSVTAQLVLDSSKFLSGLEEAKSKIKGLSGNIGTGNLDTLAKKVAEVNSGANTLKNTFKDIQSTMMNWASSITQELEKTESQVKSQANIFNEMQSNMMKWSRNITQELTAQQEKLRLLKDEWQSFKVLYDGLLSKKPMDTFVADMDKANAETKKFSSEFAKMKESLMGGDYGSAGQFFIRLGEDIAKVGMESTKSGEQVANFEKQIIALKNAISSGRQFTILDGANGSLDSTSEKVAKLRAELERLYTAMSTNTTRGVSAISNTVNQTSQQLSNLSRNVTQTSSSFKNMSTASTGVVNSVNTMNGTFGGAVQNVRNVGTAYNTTSGVMTRYKDSANQASASTSRLGTSASTATSGMNNLSSSANKLQGALSSVKMMATALSSMFIWTFGMSLYEATKQTLESKNEMESYLNQMGMGRGAINLFNQGLDETADRFKKLNKYMIGETIASIGMEFDLTANQMKKSMEVVAMVQNEYVRAGRKESEASLAVKDILQGEFLRLSRETGVGKADLEATGLWQGDLKDVEGLMDALKKVGEDRHWDLFASKCNSLNDVVSETRNRISEFGASLADQFSPAIVTGFNMIIGVIDQVTATWNNFDPTQKFMVGIPAILAFGTALMMVAGNLSLVEIAQLGYGQSLLTTIMRLDVATVKEYGLATAIATKVTSLDAETVAYAGNLTSMFAKIAGLDAYILKEYGLTTAVNVATGTLDMNTMSYDANTVAQAFNNGVTEEGTAVVGGFTIVKELEQAVMQSDTELTEFNTIAHQMNKTAVEEETVSLWGLIGAMTALEAIAVIAVLAGIAIALGSLAMEAQRAKEAMDGFYDIVDNGDAYIEDSKKNIESLGQQYDNLSQKIAEAKAKGEDTWRMEQTQASVKADKEFAEAQLKDLESVNEKAKKSAEDYQNRITQANTDFERRNADLFKNIMGDTDKAREYANQYTQQYEAGIAQMEIAVNAYHDTLDDGLTHMENQDKVLKEMGADEQSRIQYAKEYGQEVLKNAEYQKEWAEGDFWAIFKIGLSDAKLALIDLYYWMGQFEWWKDLCHALGEESKIVGDNFREWTTLQFERIGKLAKDLETIYTFIKAIDDYGKGDDNSLLNWLSDRGDNESPLTKDNKFDINHYTDYLKDFLNTDFLDLSSSLPMLNMETSLLNWLLPKPAKDQISGRIHDIMNSIGDSFKSELEFIKGIFSGLNIINLIIGGLFNSDGGTGEEGSGVAKTIPENNIISQIIQKMVGDDPIGAVTTAVDTYIVQPFSQAIQIGLANIPIVGDVLSFLGLIDTTAPTASEKGNNLGQTFGQALEQKIYGIPILGDILGILNTISGANPTANSQGYGVGSNIKGGVDSGKAGTAQLVSSEMGEVISAVANAIGQAWSTAQQVGQAILNGINSVIQHHSPGIPAQLIGAEMEEIQLAMANAVGNIYQQAQEIGSAITTGIQPNTNIEFDADAMAQYQTDMIMAMGMASETVDGSESAFSQLDYTTATTFASIGNTIGTTMLNIANTTRLNYNNIALTTKTQLTNMQSQTTKNIGAIRQSWTGMQVALIASAEHIRSETGAKINSLQNNMASFWRKVQNPALLLGAGSPSEEHKGARPHRYSSSTGGVRKLLSGGGFAGSPLIHRNNSNPRGARTGTGISDKIKNKTYQGISIFDALEQYIECRENGGNCFAGGWDFNWSDDIKQALLTWHTNFGEIYDPYLYVGKFENDDFPVRGIAPIAKNYIYDAISRTSYEYYFDSKYGSPLEAWNAGHFNCYDGALLVMALASAFGFSSHMVHGSWAGIPHVWAYVDGIGDIDATAIQGGYGFTAPSRTGAGSPYMEKRFKHNRMPSDDNNGGNTFNGDIHIHIDGTGKDTEEIGNEVRNVMVDLMSPNPSTGI